MLRHFFAAFLALAPVAALAAPVSSPVIDVPLATGDVTSFENTFDLLSFDAPATGQGFQIASDLLADMTLTWDGKSPYTSADGYLALHAGGQTLLDGVLSEILPQEDALSLIFTDLRGDLASAFGSQLLVGLFFFDLLGEDPLAALMDHGRYDFALMVEGAEGQPAPVPLPAGGVLLLSALGGLALRRFTAGAGR